MSDITVPYQAKHVYGKRWPGPHMKLPPADTTGLAIATQVDPRPQMPPIFDQGQLGSCTANTTAGCFQYDAIQDGKDCGLLARLWIYYFERSLEGTLGQGDTGAIGHDAFTVAKHGIPPETDWPYDISTFQNKPSADEPRAYTLSRAVHAPVQTKTAVQQVLSNGQTIAFGFTVYQSFESEQVAQTGIMPVPQPGEQVLGGHEVLAVGYLEDQPDYVLCRNSWGSVQTDGVEWGLDGGDGYFLFPWSCFLDSSMTSDFRTIVRAVS